MAAIPFHLTGEALWRRMERAVEKIQDQMHLLDMIDVELVDASWCGRFPPELAARLKELLDNPDG